MQRFCVTTMRQPTGEHVVHRRDADCALLPPQLGREVGLVDLGHHDGCEGAMRAAREVYRTVDACPRCAPACSQRLSEEAIVAALSAAISAGLSGTS